MRYRGENRVPGTGGNGVGNRNEDGNGHEDRDGGGKGSEDGNENIGEGGGEREPGDSIRGGSEDVRWRATPTSNQQPQPLLILI